MVQRPARSDSDQMQPGRARVTADLDLRGLTIDLLTAVGGLVEEKNGVLDVLVPEPHQAQFNGEAFLRLTFDSKPAYSDAQLVSVGSPITEQIIGLAGGFGLTSRWYIGGLRWSPRQAINLSKWRARFVNARFVGNGVEFVFACHHLLLNFRVSYISDERREDLRTVVVDTNSLQPSTLLQEFWSMLPRPSGGALYLPDSLRPAGTAWPRPIALMPRTDYRLSDQDRLPDRATLSALRNRAVDILERQISDSIANYRRRTARQLERERLRLETFYEDTENELRRRLERADAEDRRRSIESKIEANRLDRERKLADITAKHRLRLVVKLLSAAIITQPKVRTVLKVENRYAGTALPVVFDPLVGELELPICHNCQEAMTSVHLCANGHLVCEECIRPCAFCKREYCRECGVDTCAVCGRPACVQSQVRCTDCGAITCRDDRGRCCAH